MIDNRLQFTDAVTKAEYITTANPGLVKKSKPVITFDHPEIANKLNEVIENQNKIIDYLNGMVKK